MYVRPDARHPLILPALVAGLLGACAPAARADGPGAAPPVLSDPDRSIAAQREAARGAAAAVAAGDAEAVARLLGDRSCWVRDATVAALVKKRPAPLLDALVALLERGDDLVAPAAAEVLAACKHAPARAALEKALTGAKSEAAAQAAAWALEALGDAGAAPALEAAHAKRKEPRVRGDALIALAVVAPARARELARAALEAREVELRIAAVEALRRADPAGAARAAASIAADKRAPARLLLAALDALRGWSGRAANADVAAAAVEALVKRLPDDQGRPRADVARTLRDLTGQADLGDDPKGWATWWAASKGAFVPREPAPAGAALAPAPGASRVRVQFHGIPVDSTRLLVLQDASGGMTGRLDAKDASSPSRLRFALDELGRLVTALDAEVKLDVAFFATHPRRAIGKLVPVGPARRQLVAWAEKEGHPPDGEGQARSNIHDALAQVLEDDEVDTVFLLSEGGPTEGRFVDDERVIDHLKRRAVYRRVRVHCLQATASKPGAKFLRALANALDGTFHDLDALRQAAGKRPS